MIEVEHITSIAPGNPFHSDMIRMGTQIGNNVTVMFHQHVNEFQETIIVVNTRTGERVMIAFGDSDA